MHKVCKSALLGLFGVSILVSGRASAGAQSLDEIYQQAKAEGALSILRRGPDGAVGGTGTCIQTIR